MPRFENLARDVRYGLRSLRRNPAFATVAILSLTVGIGANTAIFSLVNSLLLRPRPVLEPQQLVELYTGHRQSPYETSSYPSYVELRDRNEVLAGLAAYGIRQVTISETDHVEQLWGEAVSGNYFDVLGVLPYRGRTIGAADDVVGADPVVMIGHGLWQRRFNGDPDVVGRTVVLNRQRLTVVGVVPPQYTGMIRGLSSEVFIPTTAMPLVEAARAERVLSRGSRWLTLVGRLKPGTSLEQARTRFEQLSLEMQAAHPQEWKARQQSGAIRELFVSVLPESETRIHPGMFVDALAMAALLVVIVNVVLLIARMNLANMLLARAVARRKEVAIRLALGAGRMRLIRQLIAESVLLSLMAGAAGVVLTVWMLNLIVAFMPALPEGIRVALDLQIDWRVLVYAIGFSTLTGVLFGLAPALQGSRADVSTVLKSDSSVVAGGHRRSRVRKALVVAQVAFSLLLLIGAGLMLRTLDKLRPTALGFSSDNMLLASLDLDERYDRNRSQQFYRQLAERVSLLPGVQAVSLIDGVPGGFTGSSRRGTEIEGYQPAPGESLEVDANFVGPRYFTNMQVPIVQGRDFDERDREGAPCVAIVNVAFVQRYVPAGSSPLGKHVTKFEYGSGTVSTRTLCAIVGVIRDDRWQSLATSVRPFHALAQQQSDRRRMSVFVHTDADPAGLARPVRRAVQELDPTLPVNDIQTLRDYFSVSLYPFRLMGIFMGACGLTALLIATLGIYGVVSYSVAQRTREVGVRMALGAVRTDILRMVVGQGMALVAWGLVTGLTLSAALTRVLTSVAFDTGLLFGVSATDILTFAGVTTLLAVVAVAACAVPALRASRVDPIEALRTE